MIALMLHPKGVGVADRPPELFQYPTPDSQTMARAFLPFIEQGFSDEEAWHVLVSDDQRLECFKVSHGNRKGRRRQRGLFDVV